MTGNGQVNVSALEVLAGGVKADQAPVPGVDEIMARLREQGDPLAGHKLLAAGLAKALIDNRARELAKEFVAAQEPVEVPAGTGLADMLQEPEEDEEWRVKGIQPAGTRVVFSAMKKSGKTTMIGNLLNALTGSDPFGSAFLGRFTVTQVPGTVVLIDFEMSRGQLRRWYREMAFPNPERVHVFSLRGQAGSFNIIDPRVRAQWAARLRELPGGTSYLVLDCLGPICAALGINESVNAEIGPLFDAIDALLLEAEIPDMTLVHHHGHVDERSRGASRIGDWPDIEWKLVREKDDKGQPLDSGKRFFSAFGRDVEQHEAELTFHPATRGLTIGESSRAAYKATKHHDTVTQIATAEPGLTFNKLLNKVVGAGVPQAAARSAIKSLADTGDLHTHDGPNRSKHHYVCECANPLECDTHSPPAEPGDSSDSR